MMAEAVSTLVADMQASEGKQLAFKKELGEAQAKLREAEEKAKRAESELGRANERIRAVESDYALCQSSLHSSETQVAHLAADLRGKKRENDALKLKLQQAEEREKEAVEQARMAVENFRRSAEYQDELAEEAVDGLIRGFEDFREQVTRKFPKVNFRLFRPRLGSEDDQDLRWVEELEDVPFEVVPPRLPEVISEVASEVASEGVGDPAPEVATAAVPEVVPAGPASSITNVGDKD